MEALANIGENDIAVVFMAGHGVRDENGTFYFLTSDAMMGHPESGGISWDMLGEHLSRIRSRVILFLAPCHSGSLVRQTIVPNDELAGAFFSGKRFQLRGIQLMEAGGLTPQAGALIHFDTDSADIKPESAGLLDKFGKVLANELSHATVVITGHTDSRGTDAYNQVLSEMRARAVARYLTSRFPIAPERTSCIGFGETKPLADNATQAGQALNRRVEFFRIQ